MTNSLPENLKTGFMYGNFNLSEKSDKVDIWKIINRTLRFIKRAG
jgi:hypothetical protein